MYTRGKRFISLVVACAAFTCSASFAPCATAEPTANFPHMTSALSAPLEAAEEALKAERYADAIATLKDAAAMPQKSAYDQHRIDEMLGFAYVRTKDYPEAAKALESEIDDGFLTESEVPKRVVALAQIDYQLKNYNRAAELGNRAVNEGFADDELYTLVGQAYYLDGRYDAVRDFLGRRIESLERQRRDVPQSYLQLVMSSCVKLHDSACVTAYSRRLNGPRDRLLIDPIFNRDAILHRDAGNQ